MSVDPSDPWDGAEFRVPLHLLRFLPPVTAGLNPYTLMALIPQLRNTVQDHSPILVTPACKGCGTRTILDGRHRTIASIAAGRQEILAILQDDD